MIEVVEPLARTPGVLVAALVTDDGVPVAAPGCPVSQGELGGPWADADVLAALTAAWMDDLVRALGKLSWESPRRATLRAARGTLLVLQTAGALLVVVTEQGLGTDQLWLSMEGAAARIERILRGMGERAGGEQEHASEPPAPLPGRLGAAASEDEKERRATGDRDPSART